VTNEVGYLAKEFNMTQAISTVLVRLFAAYWMITAFSYLAVDVSTLKQLIGLDVGEGSMMFSNVYYASLGIMGALIWWFSIPIARLVSGEATNEERKIEAEEIVASGSFLIGLYWLGPIAPLGTADHL